jgi:RNA recognition motif-containing protein
MIVTATTPPLHPNTTPRPVIITTPPPPRFSPHPQHQPMIPPTSIAGGEGGISSSTTSRSSTPPGTITSPEQRESEHIAAQELSPFLKRPSPTNLSSNSSGGGGNASSTSSSTHEVSSKSSSGAGGSSSSRGLAILYASSLNIPDVRSTCEAFGALESFRSDFAETKGVFFATFYDLRSAQMAVVELPQELNKMLSNVGIAVGGSGGGQMMRAAVEVEYCVPLNASSATDESMLLLSNIPVSFDEQDLSRILSSFGEVRAIHYQASMLDDDGNDDLASYMVEFFDVQDARQALMELEQTNPWGDRAVVKVATRNPTKRKQGKELMMLMSNWRQGVVTKQHQGGAEVVGKASSRTPSPPVVTKTSPPSSSQAADTTQTPWTAAANPYYQYSHNQGDLQQQYAAQLVLGPDGHYQYMLVNHYGHPAQMVIDPLQQQLMYAPVDHQYLHNPLIIPQQYHHIQYGNPIAGANYAMLSPEIQQQQQQQQQQQPPTHFIRMPSNSASSGGENNSSSLSSGSQSPGRRNKASERTLSSKRNGSGSIGSGSSGNNSGGNADENSDLTLFIKNVKNGTDIRSSVMVRNIPNKYTQQMMLAEFAAAGHGPDKMDFFYLPIDFKNKCNRGYAFVNFVDYKDIVPFFDEYNGRSWKRFNSDKICDITYARIQGKAAMLKRFENSALMEKDDEYRPMVFISHGEQKGQRESFG